MGRSTRGTLRARVVELTSGPGSEVIGTFFSLPEGGVAFLGFRLPRYSCALVADAGPGKRWSRPVSVRRLTECPVLRPAIS